jgi:hypothetical protein
VSVVPTPIQPVAEPASAAGYRAGVCNIGPHEIRRRWVSGIAGIAAAIALGIAGGSLLYELKGYDPAVLATSTALLVAVAFMAGLVPAVRASRVNPMTALRND